MLNSTFVGMQNISKFRFFCQKILPAVYDDSLSYYELLCKLHKYLNDCIDEVNLHSDAITELQEQLERWLNGDFDEEIYAAAEEYFGRVLDDYVTNETYNEGMLGKIDNNFTGFWERYSDSYHNAGWVPELENWVDGGHVNVIFNPGANIGVIDLRVKFKTYDDTTVMDRYAELGFPADQSAYLPVAKLEAGIFGPSAGMSFGYIAFWINSDGTREIGTTSAGLLVNGYIYIYTSPNALYNSTLNTYRNWFVQGTFISPACGDNGRYSKQTPAACRIGLANQARADEGLFFYKRTGTNDTSYDTRYIDCSGEVWRACNFGAGTPIAAGAGTNQINLGTFITKALPGEELDISVMEPGDLVGIGRIGYTRTIYAGTELEETVIYNDTVAVAATPS